MGLILDTSVLIDAERKGKTLVDVLTALPGSGDAAVSAITLAELADGVVRARDEAGRHSHQRFLDWVQYGVAVIALDRKIAIAAGHLNGRLRGRGITIGLADIVIAATALEAGYGVVMLNHKHFRPAAGLDVVEL